MMTTMMMMTFVALPCCCCVHARGRHSSFFSLAMCAVCSRRPIVCTGTHSVSVLTKICAVCDFWRLLLSPCSSLCFGWPIQVQRSRLLIRIWMSCEQKSLTHTHTRNTRIIFISPGAIEKYTTCKRMMSGRWHADWVEYFWLSVVFRCDHKVSLVHRRRATHHHHRKTKHTKTEQ